MVGQSQRIRLKWSYHLCTSRYASCRRQAQVDFLIRVYAATFSLNTNSTTTTYNMCSNALQSAAYTFVHDGAGSIVQVNVDVVVTNILLPVPSVTAYLQQQFSVRFQQVLFFRFIPVNLTSVFVIGFTNTNLSQRQSWLSSQLPRSCWYFDVIWWW